MVVVAVEPFAVVGEGDEVGGAEDVLQLWRRERRRTRTRWLPEDLPRRHEGHEGDQLLIAGRRLSISRIVAGGRRQVALRGIEVASVGQKLFDERAGLRRWRLRRPSGRRRPARWTSACGQACLKRSRQSGRKHQSRMPQINRAGRSARVGSCDFDFGERLPSWMARASWECL